MGRTACTEPQCLYKGELYLYLLNKILEISLIFGKLLASVDVLYLRGVKTFAVQNTVPH